MDKKEEQGEKEEQSIVIVSEEKIPLTKLPRPENRRSSGVLGLIRAALFIARRRRSRRASPKVSLWRAILGSTRPLPLHQVQPAPQNPDAFHDVLPLQLSPPHPSALSRPSAAAAAASEDAMSRYASAEDLREMDEDGEGDGMLRTRSISRRRSSLCGSTSRYGCSAWNRSHGAIIVRG